MGVMLSLAVRCVQFFAPSLSQPGTLHSCPCGLGCGNSLSAMTSKEKSYAEPTNYLSCQSGQGHNPYGSCFPAWGKSKPCNPLPGAGFMKNSW